MSAPATGTTAGTRPPSRRGALVITNRVLMRLAEQACREALRIPRVRAPLDPDLCRLDLHSPDLRGPGRPLPAGAGLEGRPVRCSVAVRHGTTRIRLALALGYPQQVGAICAHVAAHLTARVADLSGQPVGQVRVDVVRLIPSRPGGGAR